MPQESTIEFAMVLNSHRGHDIINISEILSEIISRNKLSGIISSEIVYQNIEMFSLAAE